LREYPGTLLIMLNVNWYRNRYIRIAAHILFWLMYLVINVLTAKRFYPDEAFGHMMVRFSFTLPVDMMATYLTAYGLLNWFLLRRKYAAFIATFLVSAFLLIILQRIIVYYISQPIFFPGMTPTYPFWKISWFYSFTNIFLVVAIVTSAKLLELALRQQSNSLILDREKIEAELKFLKAQVHPHFLFNTLNNLYALTLDKSDRAPEVVLKLSDLLSYMLYECNEPNTLISKEIHLIENYLDLERMRYGHHLNLDLSVTGDTTGKKIAPMLLLPFVENAFKHGVSKVSRQSFVRILLEVNGDQLVFQVINSKSPAPVADDTEYTEGIGLKNVRRRLDLLYPGRFGLEIESLAEEFKVNLNINLEITDER
jgi:sensor histidine kinase YesM